MFTRQEVAWPKEENLSHFERAKEVIEGKFGDTLPKFVIKAWETAHNEPYKFGCTHNIKWRAVKTKNWNRPMPFPMQLNPLESILGKQVIDGGTDPVAWLDSKYKITYNHIISRHGLALEIHTRSDLIAHDDYRRVLDKDHHIVIYISEGVTPEELRELEPGAPSNERRLKAFELLYSEGFNVTLVKQNIAKLRKAS